MASILIRDISDDDLARIDAHATQLGLSRTDTCGAGSTRTRAARPPR